MRTATTKTSKLYDNNGSQVYLSYIVAIHTSNRKGPLESASKFSGK